MQQAATAQLTHARRSRYSVTIDTPTGDAWTSSLRGDTWIVGSGADADLRLVDDAVLPAHAELRIGSFGRLWIYGLDSPADVYVNGHRVRAHLLSDGDLVRLGNHALRVKDDDARRSDSIPPPSARLVNLIDDDGELFEQAPPPTSGRPVPSGVDACQVNAALDLETHLSRTESVDERRKALCQWLVRVLDADRACVLRLGGEAAAVVLAAGPTTEHEETFARRAIQAVWHQRRMVVATRDDGGAVIADVVRSRSGLVDALYLEVRQDRATAPWRAIVALAVHAYRHADAMWRSSRLHDAKLSLPHELAIARHHQAELMAPLKQLSDSIDIRTEYQPCHYVGGDYIDAVTLPQGDVLLVTADVAGKGLPGALIASTLHTLVRARPDSDEPLLALVRRMNKYLSRHLDDAAFVTLVAVRLNPITLELSTINAGHVPAVISGPHGKLHRLESGRNLPLGVLADTDFTVEHASLDARDTLILYTDGLCEGTDEDQDPTSWQLWSALRRFTIEHPHHSLDDLAKRLRKMLDESRAQCIATDDAAFLLARSHLHSSN